VGEPRIAVVNQPRYLPSCGYLHRMRLADRFVYLDTVKYSPHDWENRNRIKTAAGPTWLSVPVRQVSVAQRIADTTIDDRGWRRRHLTALELNYRRAPYFDWLFPALQGVLERPWTHLAELNLALTDALLARLGWTVPWVRASDLGVSGLSGQQLLMALCREVGADVYLSGPLGRDYLEPAGVREAGLGLAFHDYVPPEYPQRFGPFVPNLSAVDLLFNCGPESAERISLGNASRADVLRLAMEAA
jgi:hypothetical protein